LVDQYTGFSPATMTFDGVHPNADGQSQIGERWFTHLAPLLDTFFAAAP
jgi:lysophospholipase L1-like esterase